MMKKWLTHKMNLHFHHLIARPLNNNNLSTKMKKVVKSKRFKNTKLKCILKEFIMMDK